MTDNHKFGFAALIGPPNAGKSTLLNHIVGQKISIISRRPQTTWHRILGITTTPDYQIAFVDTPGLHDSQHKNLNRQINRVAISAVEDVDLILFMIDYRGWSQELLRVFEPVKSGNTPAILIINKIDRLKDKSRLLPIMRESGQIHDFREIIPLSALRLDDKDAFLALVARHLPDGPCGFPENQVTDCSDRFIATELIREQIFIQLREELPYEVVIEVARFDINERDILCIDAVIRVGKNSQKSIIIGKGGNQLKQIGTDARFQIEKKFSRRVFLNLWVRAGKESRISQL